MSSYSLAIAEALVEKYRSDLVYLMALRYRAPREGRMSLRLYLKCFNAKFRAFGAACAWRDSILYGIPMTAQYFGSQSDQELADLAENTITNPAEDGQKEQ